MTSIGVQLDSLTVRYGRTTALQSVTAGILPDTITGLLGRNGSGKSTLLATIAAFRRPTSGRVTLNGVDPYENSGLMAATCLVRESGDFGELNTSEVLGVAAAVRPTFSRKLAERLLDRFGVPKRRSVEKLSRGQRSALGAAIGLAGRAPLTLFDEVYLGMDAPTRYAFYEELLADYAANPRTIVISSHLIEEVERLFEHVLVLDAGRLLLAEPADDLRQRGVRVVGNRAAVEEFAAPYTVISTSHLGRTMAATLYGDMTSEAKLRAAATGLELEHVSIQDLFVHLTKTAGPQAGWSAPEEEKELA